MEMASLVWPALTLVSGWVLIFFIDLFGKVYSGYLGFKQDETTRPLLSLFFGYLILACLGSFFLVGFQTIFTPVFVLLLFFLYRTRRGEVKRKIQLQGLDVGFFPLFLFTLFSAYRFFLVFNFENSVFHYFFMDDCYYQDCISAISTFGEERKFSEILNKTFGFKYFYSQYHYFTFSLSALLRRITGINVYYIFNFFLVPFVQMLAFSGLFYISLGITKRKVISALIALIGISTLRYNLLNVLVVAIPFDLFLKNSVVLKFYYGFQFLNSGFGLKFSTTLFLIAVFFKTLDRKEMVAFSSILLYINPLLILPFHFIQSFGIIYWRNRLNLLWSLLFLIPLVVFVSVQNYRPGLPIFPELSVNLVSVFHQPFKSILMSILGNFFSEFYGVFLFPWILILFLRKDRLEILTSLLLILYPVLESGGGPKILTTVYNPIILILVGILVYKHKRNPWFIFLFLSGVLVTGLMPFSQLMPNFNQVFLLVVYPASLLLSVYLLSVLFKDGGPKVLTGILIVVCLGNLILNFKESMKRRIPVFPSRDFESKVRKIVFQPDEQALMGIYDSRVKSMLFINQYLIGEEIQWINDQVFPVFLKLPDDQADASVFQLNAKESQPFRQFSKGFSAQVSDDQKAKAFCQKFRIAYLLVKEYDSGKIPQTKYLYSDSLHNNLGKYWVFYQKRPNAWD